LKNFLIGLNVVHVVKLQKDQIDRFNHFQKAAVILVKLSDKNIGWKVV